MACVSASSVASWAATSGKLPCSAIWTPRQTMYASGTLWKYAQAVGSAEKGAVTHPGGAAETHPYAEL